MIVLLRGDGHFVFDFIFSGPKSQKRLLSRRVHRVQAACSLSVEGFGQVPIYRQLFIQGCLRSYMGPLYVVSLKRCFHPLTRLPLL